MIRVSIFETDNSLQILDKINQLAQYLIKNNMDLKMCHDHSEACKECDIKDFCYECEEIEIWSKNYSVKIETENNIV